MALRCMLAESGDEPHSLAELEWYARALKPTRDKPAGGGELPPDLYRG